MFLSSPKIADINVKGQMGCEDCEYEFQEKEYELNNLREENEEMESELNSVRDKNEAKEWEMKKMRKDNDWMRTRSRT